MQRPATWAATVALAVAVVGGVLTVARPGVAPEPGQAAPGPSAVPGPVAEPALVGPSPRRSCGSAARPFTPHRISVPGVTSAAEVVTPARDPQGVPGIPPLTGAGKVVFAWDREQGIRPGDPAGNVLLNAHTWPDGSALGNRLLAGLREGGRIVVHGRGGQRLCYRVHERVEVVAADGMPRYYDQDGPPQLALIVCSGRRLAPGVWEKRTVWFAAPST